MTYKIDRLFGSKTRTALLSRLILDSSKSFYIREISALLKIPYSMVYKEVKNLEKLGIIKEEKKGKITIISLNRELPYLDEIKGLIIKTAGLAYVLSDAISGFKGIKFALIYGSFAGGAETEKSDVDVLIIGKVDEIELLRRIHRAEGVLRREVDYITWSDEELLDQVESRKGLITEISKKPVIMLIGEENEFRGIVNNVSGKSHAIYGWDESELKKGM